MGLITNFCLLFLASIPILINSHQVAKVRRQATLEPSWQSVEVEESQFQPSARADRYLLHNNRILAVEPYESYQQVPYEQVPQSLSSELPIESSFGKRQEEIAESELSLVEDEEDGQDEERPPPAQDRFFLDALAPLALAGLSIPAIATLGVAGAVILPLAGLALSSGFRRLFNPFSIPSGFTPGDVVLEGPAGQLLGNILARDRSVTVYNTEFTLTVLTRSTTSVNTVSSSTLTGSTVSYLVYYSTATWSSTDSSVSVSTYSSPVPTVYTSSATSSATFLSSGVSSSVETAVSVTVPVQTLPVTYTSSATSLSTTTSTPVTETSTTTTTNVVAASLTETTTYTSTLYMSTCSVFYP